MLCSKCKKREATIYINEPTDKEKNNQRKREINYYAIFNNESEQLSNKIKVIFKEHLLRNRGSE